MEVDVSNQPNLPTPPYYNRLHDMSNKMIQMERDGKVMIEKYQKYILIYGALLIVFSTGLFFYCFYIEMNWIQSHLFLLIFTIGVIVNTLFRLFLPIKSSYYNGGYIPVCSEEERSQAIERAQLALKYNKKLIETNYLARYCIYCNHFLPPRAYHCMICNKCTLERDHHCSWLGCCVGKSNLRAFWQFLVSMGLIGFIGSYHFSMFWYEILFVSNIWTPFSFKIGLLYYFIIMMTCISFSITALMILMLYIHTRDILYGLSGVEIGELNTKEHNHENVHHPPMSFSNFKKVLGPNILYWIFPLQIN
ncbi:palmitoyltransferase ZDHHC18, putative [Entamoeba dispar SAW760]|uniref:Palmitoyltransferase n=1 Tax=Entamoeba dispar (strain ATCC PRA-260 / SAW760) TaxID=370354 RepID=B0EK68_ENTDS|nr:palmitoyltransferase ZDHHC18, putative [Entamoeba dispar SAW760]EDR25076.1 palmitoyltransferase ZDHHC18, putative [Entamoeba dispar SAW760]|eukprot:EDR25076.1 palmitoyltransferase ZDHHC18, putative [Entamoeba dispar SAW760]